MLGHRHEITGCTEVGQHAAKLFLQPDDASKKFLSMCICYRTCTGVNKKRLNCSP